MAPTALTGYYRFTDIWFEWHQALPNQADISTLKAVLQYDALIHPDHPLMEDPSKGVLKNQESRLMFSSAQVEYVRYWLHAMKLTEEPIPIPDSEALLTSEQLQTVSPVFYTDAATLKKAIKTIEKNNKKLRYVDNVLMARRNTFERVRTFWAEQAGIWCAIDFESWERDHTILTELGWALIRWDKGKEISEQGHIIVKENRAYSNGTYVPDHRDKFLFGTSDVLDKKTFKKRVADLLAQWQSSGPLFLVFHDAGQDIKYLKSSSVEAPLPFLNRALPDVVPGEGTYVVDTADLFAALEGESAPRRRGLEQMCRHLQISTDYLHNAGNDAYYTLQALKSMASGDPVDMQREKRWPNHTEGSMTGVKVQFQPWEENSDYSDSEGLMPAPKLKLPGDPEATLDPAYEAQMLQEQFS
ncbi:hypothetical protein NEOLEDRAFT_1075745 [Neolentinus lepideus HHB14362 ss-1]|uniref:Gfd2/YDR514C-like C-terminal domain-containing protein n=1 Tax=Neolentinus lepideus HHB14362 ss-1 TaxID=1314782 RepID=A0A165P0P1_9AGAM|nr:hypothetical protein NEOLEDRAFT_1075745 [Neolentinus lepideus HHB14362 ss-1]